jgi:uncharacterized membrane protein YqjE
MSESPKDGFSSSPFGAQHTAGAGLLGSVRQLLSTVLETVQVRLELLGTELESEKRRLLDVVVLAALALVCLSLGLVLLCAMVVLLVDEAWRLAAAGAMALLMLGTGLALLGRAKWRLRNPSGMFHASAQELARDRGQE